MIKKMCAGVLAFLAACSSATGSTTGSNPDLRLGISSELFVRDSERGIAVVPFVIENRGAAALQVPRCGDRISLEVLKAQGSTWAQYAATICPANLPLNPLTLAPGATAEGTYAARDAGRFRIRVAAECDCPIRMRHPAESRSFEVR